MYPIFVFKALGCQEYLRNYIIGTEEGACSSVPMMGGLRLVPLLKDFK